MKAGERYLRLVSKIQYQCRKTPGTLSAIKNLPMVYARQANVSTGPQQLNNTVTYNHAPATENQNLPNKLVELSNETPMDTITKGNAGLSDSKLETLDKVNRPKIA